MIVTADHGEHLGEQRLYGHGCSLYRPELHVPLLVFARGAVPAGQVVSSPVSLRDPPSHGRRPPRTGGRVPLPRPFAGGRLVFFFGEAASTDCLVSEVALPPEADPNGGRSPVCRGPMLSLVADGWHYIRNGDGREELYDFKHDTEETHDLAGLADKAEVLRTLRDRVVR